MVPVITHAVTNRLLFRRHVIYVLQKRCFEMGIALGFRSRSEGCPSYRAVAYIGKFEREVKE